MAQRQFIKDDMVWIENYFIAGIKIKHHILLYTWGKETR